MFNLQVLNDKEFEDLCKDLLENELGIRFQNFKKGPDQGIDLRHSTDNENSVVVQVKHFLNSKYPDLKYQLIRREKAKLQKLVPKPTRYIICTSLALSPKQVDEIVSGLDPFVQSANDVYGLDRILSLLRTYSHVVEKHYKLWLSSAVVLDRILNNGIRGRSEFHAEKILKNLSLYVPTRNFQKAIDKLNENRFVIITGLPGIGKTTISYLLICDLLSKGYELIYIYDRISDAEQMLSPDPLKKQIFYFDDFLGSNTYDILSVNTEASIVGFIDRIRSSKSKFLILTTRTTILNQAQLRLEKFQRSEFGVFSKYEVELKQYSSLDKARILYNHIYHGRVALKFLKQIKKDKAYLKIINHTNFSPRLIEFISSFRNFKLSGELNYLQFVFKNLENPDAVWKNAYENQLDDEDRFLIMTMFSLGGSNVESEHLELAFVARQKFEISNHGHKLKNNAFNDSVRKLLDGFITSKKDPDGRNSFTFLNPSIGDFLLNYLKQHPSEKWRIIRSVVYFEQLTKYFHTGGENYIPYSTKELFEFMHFFETKAVSLKSLRHGITKTELSIDVLYFYLSFHVIVASPEALWPWVAGIIPGEIKEERFERAVFIVVRIGKYHEALKKAMDDKWDALINRFYSLAMYIDDYQSIRAIFRRYDKDFDEFLSRKENIEHLANCVVLFFCRAIGYRLPIAPGIMSEVIKLYNSGNTKDAFSIIRERIYKEFNRFTHALDLTEYHKILVKRVETREDSVLDQILDEYCSDTDSYGSGNTKPKIENLQDEASQIDRLFE